MVIRKFDKQRDMKELIRIHGKFFAKEFSIDNFNHLIDDAFIIEKHDKTIAIGGVRSLAEAILVTDLEANQVTKVRALKELINIFGYVARRTGHDAIHAFIEDDTWRNHLIDEGFSKCKGEALILGV